MSKVVTVGELRKALGGAQDDVPVRLNIQADHGRKAHSPWIDYFKLHWSDNDAGKSVVVIQGYLVEV